MALTQVTGPYPIFTDLDGTPLDDGYLYIGAINQDPEQNPIQVFWDSNLTIPATQPIRTSNGYAYRNGTPALLYTGGEFSITIRNKREEFVLYSPVGYGFDPAAVSASVVKNDFVGDGVEVNFVLSAAPSTILATNIFINGVYQEKDSYTLSGNTITFSIAPPLNSSIEVMTNETGVINSGNATAITYTLTAAGAVQQTVQTKLEQYVSVKDFGAVGDGVTDDRVAIQAALNASKSVYFPAPSVSYYISDSVSPQSNTLIYGDGFSSHIQVPNGTVNCFYVNGVSGVIVRDLKISTVTQTNATAYKCAVLINNSANCLVENVLVFNMGHWGVGIYDASGCIVRGCRFATWFGTVQDSAGIAVYNNSNNNLIEENYCLANSDHGILVQDPNSGATPTGNSIVNNKVANAKTDGIVVYVTTAYDTQTLVSGNRVFDIVGTGLSGQSGHGIYIQSAGGAIVSNNTLTNCCQSTSSFETQVVGAIGVATGDTTTYPSGTINQVIVVNNHITAQRGPAIAVQTCGVPVLVEGNTILSTGTTAVRGEAIYSVNANGLQVKNNIIAHANANYSAINIGASNTVIDGVAVVGNRIRGNVFGISFNVTGTGTFTNAVITNNIVSGLSSTALFLSYITGSQISNNNFASTGAVLSITDCPKARLTANRFFSSSGSSAALFTGTPNGNAGLIADESNDFSCLVLHDAGTGGIISQYGNAAPASSGSWAVSDRVIQSVSVVGQPKGWRCTVAGNPGTWVSEGNL